MLGEPPTLSNKAKCDSAISEVYKRPLDKWNVPDNHGLLERSIGGFAFEMGIDWRKYDCVSAYNFSHPGTEKP